MSNDILQTALFLVMQLTFTIGLHFAWFLSDVSTRQKKAPQKAKYDRAAKLCLLGLYLVYILFSVFRSIDKDFGGADAYHYWNYYRQANCTFPEFSKICTMEVGFRLLLWLFRQFGIPFRVLLFVIHTLMFGCVALFSKYCHRRDSGFLSLLATFLLCSELFVAFCIIRNAMALALSLVFFVLMDQKRYRVALVPMLLALSIHLSSLILFVVYVVLIVLDKANAQSKKSVLLWLGALLLAELWVIPLIDVVVRHTKYAYYIGSNGVALGTYAILAVVTMAIVLDDTNKLINTTHAKYLLVGWFCLPLQMNYGILYRTLLFFMPVLYMILPNVSHSLGAFPVYFDRAARKICFDRSIFPRITRENFKDWRIYVPLVKVALKLCVVVYMLNRALKMFTADYVSYGLYSYIPYFLN